VAAHWTLDSINWAAFDRSKIDPELVKVVRSAALVEFGGRHYADYLCNVFADDAEFCQVARDWALEEVQHGAALGKWATLVDPSYDLEAKYSEFRKGYSLDTSVNSSVRGSRAGELVARCMVETGTSSYYTAMAEKTDEPVLKEICQHIAADELRHYKLFYTHLKRYLEKEPLSLFARLKVAVGRIAESEDDELAYAYYAANNNGEAYDRATHSKAYMRRAFGFYRQHHIERAVGMIFKACGLKPQTIWYKGAAKAAWWSLNRKVKQLEKLAA
jgi:rubrerythrin